MMSWNVFKKMPPMLHWRRRGRSRGERWLFPLCAVLLWGAGETLPNVEAEEKVDAKDYRLVLAEAVRNAANHVLPSIVTIEPIGTVNDGGGEVSKNAIVSGVIVSGDGHILTASMLTKEPVASLLVTLSNGSRKAATVVATDYHRELVLLKVDSTEGIAPLPLTSSSSTRVGQTVVAVGRYGTESTPIVSRGILSAKGRLNGIALQTDARVSPSFYGGPLVDLSGEVLGVLIPAVAEGGAENMTDWYDSGIAFAIPSETIAAKLERLSGGESIKKGILGVVAQTKDPYDDGTDVASVRLRSPAEKAGIKAGDTILAVGGQGVRRHLDIKQQLGAFDAGDIVPVRIRRGDSELNIDVTLAESIPPLDPQAMGVIVKRVSAESDESSEVVIEGVVPGSVADSKLEPGDVIKKVGETEVTDVGSLRRILLTAESNTDISLTIGRDNMEKKVMLKTTTVAQNPIPELPESWKPGEIKTWVAQEIKLPDAANVASVLAPGEDDGRTRLGLLLLLLNPGEGAPEKSLGEWAELATATGVVVCAVAPQENERWKPQEIDVVSRLASLVMNQYPVDRAAIAVASGGALFGEDSGAADAMAIAVAITEKRTFSGVAVSDQTKPPAVRLTENDPEMPLQFLFPVKDATQLPSWTAPLRQAGYPVLSGGDLIQRQLLVWTRLLQAI